MSGNRSQLPVCGGGRGGGGWRRGNGPFKKLKVKVMQVFFFFLKKKQLGFFVSTLIWSQCPSSTTTTTTPRGQRWVLDGLMDRKTVQNAPAQTLAVQGNRPLVMSQTGTNTSDSFWPRPGVGSAPLWAGAVFFFFLFPSKHKSDLI